MKYTISKKEIKRRRNAFIRLSLSSIVGALITVVILPPANIFISLAAIGIFVLFLLALWIVAAKSFRSLKTISVQLTKNFIERTDFRKKDKIKFADVRKIKVTKSIKGKIREIQIVREKGATMILNGLKNLEQLYSKLKSKCGKNISIKEKKEFIDYDHWLFYVILGLLVGNVLSLATFYFSTSELENVKILFMALAVNNIILGLYFIFTKPISKRYGENTKYLDYIFFLVLILSGILMVVL